MITREKIEEFWDSLEGLAPEFFDENFNEVADKLVEFLIVSFMEKESICVGITGGNPPLTVEEYGDDFDFFEDEEDLDEEENDNEDCSSIITYDFYDKSDKELELICLPNDIMVLRYNFFDWDQEMHVYTKKYSGEDLKIFPEGLIEIMRKVRDAEESKDINFKAIMKKNA